MTFISLVLLFAAIPSLAQVPNLAPEASEVVGFQATRFSECNAFIQTCPPPAASCANVICQQCTGLGQSKLNACCATESAPGSCLATALLRNPNAAPATTTPAAVGSSSSPSSEANALPTSVSASASLTGTGTGNTAPTSPLPTGSAACEDFASSLSQCNSQTPGFTSSVFSVQASCLCYDSNQMFNPADYDGVWNNCLSYYKTASTAFFSSLEADGPLETAPCSSAGNAAGGGSSGSSTRAPAPVSTSGQTSSVRTSTSSAAAHPKRGERIGILSGAGFGGMMLGLLGLAM